MSGATDPTSFVGRWWRYQAERFPLLGHGPLILAFSFCAVSFSANLRDLGQWPRWGPVGIAFITCLLFFLQLRIADEFKDAEEDATYRPYRPVPRGLVRLRELGWLFVIAAIVQGALAIIWEPRLFLVLGIAWAYLTAMSNEFFIRDWLKAHPIHYLWTHMLIMPLVDLYATSCDCLTVPGQGHPPGGLFLFLVASFTNGIVIEFGRKIRSPADEETGVETYSVLWGRQRATITWLAFQALTAGFAIAAAWQIGMHVGVALVLVPALLVGIGIGGWFLRDPAPKRGKVIETWAGVWTLALYATLGIVPALELTP